MCTNKKTRQVLPLDCRITILYYGAFIIHINVLVSWRICNTTSRLKDCLDLVVTLGAGLWAIGTLHTHDEHELYQNQYSLCCTSQTTRCDISSRLINQQS